MKPNVRVCRASAVWVCVVKLGYRRESAKDAETSVKLMKSAIPLCYNSKQTVGRDSDINNVSRWIGATVARNVCGKPVNKRWVEQTWTLDSPLRTRRVVNRNNRHVVNAVQMTHVAAILQHGHGSCCCCRCRCRSGLCRGHAVAAPQCLGRPSRPSAMMKRSIGQLDVGLQEVHGSVQLRQGSAELWRQYDAFAN